MAVTARPPQTAPGSQEVEDALEPVRAALLARARAEAARLLAAADADAAAALDAAAEESRRIHHQARAEVQKYAQALAAEHEARVRRETRTVVLAAQRAAYDELRRRARDGARRLRDDPAYPSLLARLRKRAHAELGPDADIHEHPDGGLVAAVAGRRLTLTLTALADRAVDDLGATVEGLWQP